MTRLRYDYDNEPCTAALCCWCSSGAGSGGGRPKLRAGYVDVGSVDVHELSLHHVRVHTRAVRDDLETCHGARLLRVDVLDEKPQQCHDFQLLLRTAQADLQSHVILGAIVLLHSETSKLPGREICCSHMQVQFGDSSSSPGRQENYNSPLFHQNSPRRWLFVDLQKVGFQTLHQLLQQLQPWALVADTAASLEAGCLLKDSIRRDVQGFLVCVVQNVMIFPPLFKICIQISRLKLVARRSGQDVLSGFHESETRTELVLILIVYLAYTHTPQTDTQQHGNRNIIPNAKAKDHDCDFETQ